MLTLGVDIHYQEYIQGTSNNVGSIAPSGKQELHNTGTGTVPVLPNGSLCHAENFILWGQDFSDFRNGNFYPAYKIRFQNGFEVGFIFNIGFKGGG